MDYQFPDRVCRFNLQNNLTREFCVIEQLKFKLPVFEGPLELMLHLISKHKLDIYDIEISVLLEQYIEYIEQLKLSDLEVSSEFLTMAARLVYIKTMSLLPRHEEADELKRELVGQLLEYRLIKLVAEEFKLRYKGNLLFVREQQEIEIDRTYIRSHSADELLDAYLQLRTKVKQKQPPPKSEFTSIVSRRIVPVEARIVYILRTLYEKGEIDYSLVLSSEDKSEKIATFLAMLELIKSKRIFLTDDNSKLIFNKTIGVEADLNSESWRRRISIDGDRQDDSGD